MYMNLVVGFITIYLGRISFPLFAFLLTEGYVHTSNLKKYFYRLFVFGLISQIPFLIFRTYVGVGVWLNIMFTLLLGLFAILIFDKVEFKLLSFSLVAIIAYIGYLIKVDYGWFGVILVFLFYLFKSNKLSLTVSFISLVLIRYYLINALDLYHIYSIVFTILPILIIWLYNGKEGKKLKYFYYLFYPIHLIILDLIGYFIN